MSPLILSYAAAILALFLFERLAMEVREGDAIRFDQTVREFVHGWASPGLTALMTALTVSGTLPVVLPVSVLVCLVLWFRGRQGGAILFAVTMLGAVVLMDVLKLLFHRVRPESYFNFPLPHNFSFPSGHALGAFCFWGVLAVICSTEVSTLISRIVIWSVAVFMVLGIGLSRIYLGVHYPSDVAGGYLAGMVWVSGVGWLYRAVAARSHR